MARSPNQPPPRHCRRPAFTLVELMISLFLALLLIVGINSIFKMSAATVGSAQQLSDLNRQLTNARQRFELDFASFADPSVQPAFIISGLSQPSFRDARDEKSDTYYARGQAMDVAHENCLKRDIPGTAFNTPFRRGGGRTALAPSIVFDDRMHRVDIMAFGAQGVFSRQTGSHLAATDAGYQSSLTANEAWIYYGHLRIPMNPSSTANTFFRAPGMVRMTGTGTTVMTGDTNTGNTAVTAVANPFNFYAAQWLLGRTVILLKDPTSMQDTYGNNIDFIPSNSSPAPNGSVPLAPLAGGSLSNAAGNGPARYIYSSRCDVGGTTLAQFYTDVQTAYYPGGAFKPDWFFPLLSATVPARIRSGDVPAATAAPAAPAFEDVLRFAGVPFLDKTNTANMQANVAQSAPVFVRGCTQFMVEYAGDYLTQNLDATNTNYGRGLAVAEDGEIDFDVYTDAAGNRSRKIRWYGLTRSTDGGADEAPLASPPARPEVVHPLHKHVFAAGLAASSPSGTEWFPFEKDNGSTAPFPASPTTKTPAHCDTYTCAWSPADILFDNDIGSGNSASNLSRYGAAFPSHTFLPRLIRITVRVDDPYGRLAEGQTAEYVFTLPRPALQ